MLRIQIRIEHFDVMGTLLLLIVKTRYGRGSACWPKSLLFSLTLNTYQFFLFIISNGFRFRTQIHGALDLVEILKDYFPILEK